MEVVGREESELKKHEIKPTREGGVRE